MARNPPRTITACKSDASFFNADLHSCPFFRASLVCALAIIVSSEISKLQWKYMDYSGYGEREKRS
ncbi:hypothetical protein BACPEC_03080 [[Bacteroides] pectinophilus ATCC 43243]|uniref:Uncharacterized protein n=1 Tax=[Bacteroides] pectinophilus ATCC 43243 TaxID=483218 RepID=B7AWI1_9FIRM|nr:hypothetical protein BACPEC_03080 [[Bacteroides] pectinophilus ATCC 43243]